MERKITVGSLFYWITLALLIVGLTTAGYSCPACFKPPERVKVQQKDCCNDKGECSLKSCAKEKQTQQQGSSEVKTSKNQAKEKSAQSKSKENEKDLFSPIWW